MLPAGFSVCRQLLLTHRSVTQKGTVLRRIWPGRGVEQVMQNTQAVRLRGPGKRLADLPDGPRGAGLLTDRAPRAVQTGARDLGFTPIVQLIGPLDDTVSDDLASNLLRVLSEGLSNAIRHSGAKNISISLTASQNKVELLIIDDGCGFRNPERISGLANMEQRAASVGGTFSIDSPPRYGTRLCWTAPTT